MMMKLILINGLVFRNVKVLFNNLVSTVQSIALDSLAINYCTQYIDWSTQSLVQMFSIKHLFVSIHVIDCNRFNRHKEKIGEVKK